MEIIAECSHEKFHEIKIHWEVLHTETPLEELEPFFTSWANRIPRRSLSLIIIIGRLGQLKVGKKIQKRLKNLKSWVSLENLKLLNGIGTLKFGVMSF